MKLKFRLKSTYSGISGRFKWNGQMLLIFVCSFENIRETEWKWSSTVFYFAKGKGNKKGPPDHSCKILCSSKKPQFNSYAPFLYSLYAKNIWYVNIFGTSFTSSFIIYWFFFNVVKFKSKLFNVMVLHTSFSAEHFIFIYAAEVKTGLVWGEFSLCMFMWKCCSTQS